MEVSIAEAARILGQRGGRAGGRVRSQKKAEAARRNGQLGGRPKITNKQIEQFATKVVTEWQEINA